MRQSLLPFVQTEPRSVPLTPTTTPKHQPNTALNEGTCSCLPSDTNTNTLSHGQSEEERIASTHSHVRQQTTRPSLLPFLTGPARSWRRNLRKRTDL